MFDAGVVGAGLGSEAEAEDVAVVRAVSDEERAIHTVRQTRLGVVKTHRAPVPTALRITTIHRSSLYCGSYQWRVWGNGAQGLRLLLDWKKLPPIEDRGQADRVTTPSRA